MFSPVELEIELFCRGMRIDPSCTSVRTAGGSVADARRTWAPVWSSSFRGRAKAIWVNVSGGRALRRDVAVSPGQGRRGRYRVRDDRDGGAYPVENSRGAGLVFASTSSGIEMSRIGVLQGNYLGVYVSNACLYWASTPSRACKFCTTGKNVGVAEQSRKNVEDVVEVALAARDESGSIFTHLNTGYHFEEVDRLEPIHGLRQCEPFVRAVRERVGGFIGVQAMPVPQAEVPRVRRADRRGRRPLLVLLRVRGSGVFAQALPRQGADARPGGLLRGDGVHGEPARPRARLGRDHRRASSRSRRPSAESTGSSRPARSRPSASSVRRSAASWRT